MRRSTRNLRGFTGVEILVVLVVIGIVAGAGYAATGLYRARAAEAEMRQDLVHFVNQQQVLRQRTGSLGTLEQLDDQGFRRSPGVVVEEDRLDGGGRRAYLRVRHLKTGQRCSVDYSPYVSNALNRVQCWAGVDDPSATENVGPGEVATTAPVTSTPVDTTDATAPPPPPLCAPAPTLGSPADQNLRPGQPGTGVFTLTNPGASARSFSLAFSSSNPAVIPSATGPASVTVPAGGSRTVTASFQLDPDAEAGQLSVLPLEATENPCPALNGFFSVATELVLGPLELSDPADVTVRAGDPVPVVWTSTSRTNARRMMVLSATEQAGLTRAPSAELGNHPYARGEPRTTALDYRLDPAMDGFEQRDACMDFYDAEATALRRRECFRVTARFLPGVPAISAPAAREAGQDELFATTWSVANTSNAPRDFRIRAEATADLEVLEAIGVGDAVRIGRGGSHRVDVKYRLKRPSLAGTESRGRLHVADVNPEYVPPSSNTVDFVVLTKLEVCAPGIAAAPSSRTERPGAAISATWQLQNCTNAQRDLTLATEGDTDVLAAGGSRTESFAPFEVRTVTLPYRMRNRSVHLTRSHPTLQASDAGLATPSSFEVTTALALCAPTLAGPAGVPAQPQAPGTVATVGYTIQNCSNAPRTFAAPVSSSNPAAVPDPGDPANLVIAAYGSAGVAFTYGIPANAYGGVPSDVSIRVADADADSLFATGRFRVTPRIIRAAPTFSAFAAQTILPGQSGSGSATLTSQSNVAVRYCFTASVSAGSAPAGSVVSPAPSPGACVDIDAPFGTASLSQSVTIAAAAEHPWTNQVTVTAVDQAANLTATETFTATAALQLANPTLQVPATPPDLPWLEGQTQEIKYLTRNQSNAMRTLCLTVAPANTALAAVTPTPVCAVVGARQSYTFAHSLRAGTATKLTVLATVYDQDAPEYQAQGSFSNEIKDVTPVAAWTTPGSVYMRKWFDVDGKDSSSPIGRAIVKYIWTWGVHGVRWDGTRFVSGGSGVATDESATSTARRAYDTTGVFSVCLTVVDEDGRVSKKNCKDVRSLRMTRAQLKWRYRGWWYDPSDFCWDVPWDNQCPMEHGNARWEVLLDASQGDVPIVRAWAVFQVEFWQTDDKFEQKFSYEGNGEKLASYTYASGTGTSTYDFFSNAQKASGNVQKGIWRVLTTEGTGAGGWPQAPNLANHPLVLNANLGSATGAFDGGPHWVPDEAWVTLYVLDANGVTTSQSGFYDHKRSQWRGSDCIDGTSGLFCKRGFERLLPPASAPTGSIEAEVVDQTHRLTGSGDSPDGRIVDMYWEVYVQPLDLGSGPGGSYQARGSVLELSPEQCATQEVTLYLIDDRGSVGAAYYTVPSTGSYSECSSGGPGVPL